MYFIGAILPRVLASFAEMIYYLFLQLEGSDRSGSSQSLRHLPTTNTSNRPHSENQANNNQSPNKVTRSQSATSSNTRGQRRYSHGNQGDNNSGPGSVKRKASCF